MKLTYILLSVIFSLAIFGVVSGRTNAVNKIYIYCISNINSETQGEIVTSDYIRTPIGSRIRGYSIAYRYHVNGKDFVSNLVSFTHNSRKVASEYVNRYPVGKDVVVYYSSEVPDFSILERKNPDLMVFFQAVSVLFISIFFGFLASLIIFDFIPVKYKQKNES